MSREEAIRRIKAWNLDSDDMEVLSVVIPELRESEDERIKKFLIQHISEWIGCIEHDLKISSKDIESEEELAMFKAGLAYLEKQKEREMPDSTELIELWGEEKEILREKDFRDDRWRLAQNAFMDGVARGYGIKQKEQKRDERDFTIYYPLKNGKGEYECIPYSFCGSLTSFSEDKDLIDFLRTCFYTEEECNEWIERQKEQNRSCNNLYDEIQRFFDECIEVHDAKIYGVDERVITVDCYELTALHFAQWQKEPKPAEWSEEDEKTICEAIDYLERYAKEYVQGGNSKQYIFGIASRLDHLRPHPHPKQEWSEEDEKQIRQIERIANNAGCSTELQDQIHNWLENLRPQPHWKPSEEQMEVYTDAIYFLAKHGFKDPNGILESLYSDLKKLM